MAIAGELAQNPPTQLRLIKQLLTANAAETDLDAVQRRELEAMQTCYRSPEHAEAVRALHREAPARVPLSVRTHSRSRSSASASSTGRPQVGHHGRSSSARAAAIVVGNAGQDAIDAHRP